MVTNFGNIKKYYFFFCNFNLLPLHYRFKRHIGYMLMTLLTLLNIYTLIFLTLNDLTISSDYPRSNLKATISCPQPVNRNVSIGRSTGAAPTCFRFFRLHLSDKPMCVHPSTPCFQIAMSSNPFWSYCARTWSAWAASWCASWSDATPSAVSATPTVTSSTLD